MTEQYKKNQISNMNGYMDKVKIVLRKIQLCSPISTIAEEYKQVLQIVQQILQSIQNLENFTSPQEFECVNITQEERNFVANEVKEYKQWCNNILDLLNKADKTARFSINIEQINSKYSEFQLKCQSIVSKQQQDIIKKQKVIDQHREQQQNDFNTNKMEYE